MLSLVDRFEKVILGFRTPLGRLCLRRGVAADPAHLSVLARLSPQAVVDVGANRGQFALAVLCATSASVTCVEPLAAPRRMIEELLVPTGRVTITPVAFGSSAGLSSIHVARDDDSSSLLAPTTRQVDTFPGARTATTDSVPVSTLDAEIGAVGPDTLLKIDVQGYELEVLRGGAETLAGYRWVLVEVSFTSLYEGQCSPAEVVAHLEHSGFGLAGVVDVLRVRGEVLQADLLFEALR